MSVLFLFFLSLNIIKIAISGNCKDTSFHFDSNAGITDSREKTDKTSVYLDLSYAEPKGELVRVYIIDSDTDRIRSYGGDFFVCQLGYKYFLYNSVRESGGTRCRIYITGNPKPIFGKWSPDSVPESGVITLKKAYSQSDADLSSERANNVLQALFGNINFHFTGFDQRFSGRLGNFIFEAKLKNKITISTDCKVSCSISHSIVFDKEIKYDKDITFQDGKLNEFKDLLNKLLNDGPQKLFDKVKFAVGDGSVTLIPFDEFCFRILFEFKREPARYLTNTGELEIDVAYIQTPTTTRATIKESVFSIVSSWSTRKFAGALENLLRSIVPGIVMTGYYLLFTIVESLLAFAL